MKLPIQIEIPRRGTHCSQGNESLTPGMEYHSMLLEDEKGGVSRKDYCPVCWQNLTSKTDIYWGSKVPVKPKEKKSLPKERTERAFTLLKEYLKEDTQQNKTRAFILALFLSRRKILSAKQEVHNECGSPLIIYEVRENEEIILVPKLDPATIPVGEVQNDLAEQLFVKTKKP